MFKHFMPEMLCRQNRAIDYLGDDVLELGLRIQKENAWSRRLLGKWPHCFVDWESM